MNTTTMHNHCLSYEQLQSYSLNTSEKAERAQLYQHISTCELCACAVNGFTAIPFSSDEVDAIHHQLDLKVNATHANPLTFVQAFVACISVLSIFGFYHFVNSFEPEKQKAILPENNQQFVQPVIEKTFSVEKFESTPQLKLSAQAVVEKINIVEKVSIPVEPIKSITPDLTPVSINIPEVLVEPTYNSDIIYIYDLKVTSYNALYFNHQTNPFEIKGHTPPYKENKESENNFAQKETEEIIAADKILKSGLWYFNKGKYTNAAAEFQLLLEANPKDVNSLFYSAVCYYNIGKYDRTIKNLEAVLSLENNTFHPEAKWNLALANLKVGEKVNAKRLLTEIANEKGFYSKRAGEKLKGL
ncbi:MAG: hypothetical protein IPP64_02785 [Bacteroidetes bacterium]|nr:hypothetical protein [Bacteroidota bacterium]